MKAYESYDPQSVIKRSEGTYDPWKWTLKLDFILTRKVINAEDGQNFNLQEVITKV